MDDLATYDDLLPIERAVLALLRRLPDPTTAEPEASVEQLQGAPELQGAEVIRIQPGVLLAGDFYFCFRWRQTCLGPPDYGPHPLAYTLAVPSTDRRRRMILRENHGGIFVSAARVGRQVVPTAGDARLRLVRNGQCLIDGREPEAALAAGLEAGTTPASLPACYEASIWRRWRA